MKIVRADSRDIRRVVKSFKLIRTGARGAGGAGGAGGAATWGGILGTLPDQVDLFKAIKALAVRDRFEFEVTEDRLYLESLGLLEVIIVSNHVFADPAETEKPVVTSAVLGAVTGLTVVVTEFTATDNIAVTGYLINEVASEPALGDAGWSPTAQTSYTAASVGFKNLYFWAKDASGNISLSVLRTYTAVNLAPSAPVISLDSVGDTTATVTIDTASTDEIDGTVNLYDFFVDGIESDSDQTVLQGNTHQFTGLTNAVQVALTAKGQDSGGLLSVASNSVNATPTAGALPVFDAQPTEDSKTATTVTTAFGWSGPGNALLESSTDNGATWQTEVASQAPGAGKTQLIDTLSVDGTSPLVESTAYTIRHRLTNLTGNTTPVVSDSVVITTDAGIYWVDNFATFDTDRWKKAGTRQDVITVGSELSINTSTLGVTETASVEAAMTFSKAVSASLLITAQPSLWGQQPTLQQTTHVIHQGSTPLPYDGGTYVWWFGHNRDLSDSFRMRYRDNLGVDKWWNLVDGTTPTAGTGEPTTDPTHVIRYGIEIDAPGSRWRWYYENQTAVTTARSAWVLFANTRDPVGGDDYFINLGGDTSVTASARMILESVEYVSPV